jgi:hypothetical protein
MMRGGIPDIQWALNDLVAESPNPPFIVILKNGNKNPQTGILQLKHFYTTSL